MGAARFNSRSKTRGVDWKDQFGFGGSHEFGRMR
jgi:hypothetical protein